MNLKALLARYHLKTRQSLYNRLKGLGITLEKDHKGANFVTPEQIEQLDRLDEYLKGGGRIADYTPVVDTVVEMSPDSSIEPRLDSVGSVIDTPDDTAILQQAIEAIASRMPPISPLWWQKELERARSEGWLLSTQDLRDLIGVTPRGSTYKRGVWRFEKAGRIGNQSAWRVLKEE